MFQSGICLNILKYNLYFLLKNNCHINTEICASPKATKYLYKYIHKGGDRAIVKVDDNGSQILRNEAKKYQDLKSFGAAESAWRLFEFEMSHRYPSVKKLPVHLETEETVYMYEEVSLEDALERSKTNKLNAFFQYNAAHPNTRINYISISRNHSSLKKRSGKLENKEQKH